LITFSGTENKAKLSRAGHERSRAGWRGIGQGHTTRSSRL